MLTHKHHEEIVRFNIEAEKIDRGEVVYKRFSILQMVSLGLWGVAVFSYFFQFPIKNLASLIVPCLAGYLICKVNKLKFDTKSVAVLIMFLIYLFGSAVMSIQNGIEITRIIRFLFILLAIPICAFMKEENFQIETSIFVNLAVIKSVLILGIAITITLIGDYSVVRSWALDNGLGDIYFLIRFAPKVQVQGNALLLIAFIVEYLRQNKITVKVIVLLIGILCAGNFAYIVGLGLFIIYVIGRRILPELKKSRKIAIVFCVCIVISYMFVMPYFLDKMEEKSEVSNQVRMEQTKVLLDTNWVVGSGLGNYIHRSNSIVNYNGDIYFELQTLYILNQVGIVGLTLFYLLLYLKIRPCGIEKGIVYLIYLIYSFWNPYCFDVTQMIATLLIINLREIGKKNEESNRYGILSR